MTSERRALGEDFAPAATGLSASRLVRWSAWEMALAIALAAAAYATRYLPRPTGSSAANWWFISSLVLNAAFACVPLALLVFRHRKPMLSTLIPAGRVAQDFGWGLSLGLIVAALNALSVQRAVAMWLKHIDTGHPDYYHLIFNIGNVPSGADHVDFMRPLALFAASWGAFSPIAEEIFFRGFLYAALRRQMRAPLAVVLSAMAFALIHPFGEPMIGALILGIVVATVYEYSGSLLAPIMTHMALNLSFVLAMANRGELAQAVPPWVFIAAAAVFTLHFFVSSRYLFRRAR